MQADHLAAPAYKALPRLLERGNDESAGYQPALPFAMPTAKMVRAALLNGWIGASKHVAASEREHQQVMPRP